MNGPFDCVVIGGGSGGFGAALAAARLGLRVAVVEKEPALGGTAVHAGVSCWEPGVGGTGIPFDLYRRLKRERPSATGIYSFGRHFGWQDAWYWPDRLDQVNFPGGELLLDPARRYRDTLHRHTNGVPPTEAWCREHWHGVPFLPDAMSRVMADLLRETGNATLFLNCAFTAVDAAHGRIRSVALSNGAMLKADCWVDGTGGPFALACGCETRLGFDPDGQSANGVSLLYRIFPAAEPRVEPLPPDIPATCWWAAQFPPIHCAQLPDLSRTCNMLPTMSGRDYLQLGHAAALSECRRRAIAHWHFLQTRFPEFQHYRNGWIAPRLGVREGRRVVCERLLTETDIRLGVERQREPDIVALADHALDRHGEGGGCAELEQPYGIPYRCLIPRGWRNLLCASMGAGFSSRAASSVRLTRTIMQLGQAAGTAAALAHTRGTDLPEAPAEALREALRRQHVLVDWPMPAELADWLADE